jgi:hypothetical protein
MRRPEGMAGNGTKIQRKEKLDELWVKCAKIKSAKIMNYFQSDYKLSSKKQQ